MRHTSEYLTLGLDTASPGSAPSSATGMRESKTLDCPFSASAFRAAAMSFAESCRTVGDSDSRSHLNGLFIEALEATSKK